LKNIKKIYKPSIFWEDLNASFTNIFNNKNIKKFRRNELANNFFVPLYTNIREGKTDEILKLVKKKKFSNRFKTDIRNFITGKNAAFADYRTFVSGDVKNKFPLLNKFSESKIGTPKEHFKFEGRYFSRSSLNYLNGIVFLKQNTKNFVPKTILEIGGGFGSLAEILKYSGIKEFKYINLDLPIILKVCNYYLSKIFSVKEITHNITPIKKDININKLNKISLLENWQIENLIGKIDLFVNFISFQEMEPNIVKNYLNQVSRLKPKYILLRNLREGKQMRNKNSIGVKKPTKLKNYINFLRGNYELVKKNTIPYGFLTYDNFHSELYLFKKVK